MNVSSKSLPLKVCSVLFIIQAVLGLLWCILFAAVGVPALNNINTPELKKEFGMQIIEQLNADSPEGAENIAMIKDDLSILHIDLSFLEQTDPEAVGNGFYELLFFIMYFCMTYGFVTSIYSLFLGVLGIKAANNNSKIMPALILGAVWVAILAIWVVILVILLKAAILINPALWLNLIVPIVYLVSAILIKKEISQESKYGAL